MVPVRPQTATPAGDSAGLMPPRRRRDSAEDPPMSLFRKEAPAAHYPVEKPDAEWRRELPPEAYRVLRQHGTERAGTSPLNQEKRAGTFHCAGCGHPLFDSATKFESGTGWPSFWAPKEGGIGTT